jgi:peptidyl-prolyl cis-trans isomerase B (cyclophilin B)
MKMRVLLVVAVLFLFGAGCSKGEGAKTPEVFTPPSSPAASSEQANPATPPMPAYTFPGVLPEEQIAKKQVRLMTEKGEIVFELYADTAPKTVSNFVYLASQGFYDNLTFHRRVEGFVIQGGDPKGNGTGGPGYKFEDELDDSYKYDRGIVAMANSGPDTNGSQFFIMLKDYPLDKNYTIFGKVVSGMDVVDKIVVGDKMASVKIEEKK